MQLSHFLAENGTPAAELNAEAVVTYGPAAGGGFEFNGTVAGGYRLNITNQGIYIRYPNGNLAVELGVLQ